MDRIRWREIDSSLLPRSEAYRLRPNQCSHSIWERTTQHRRGNELVNGQIHSTRQGSLFLFFCGTRWLPKFNWTKCSLENCFLLKRQLSEYGRGSWGKHRRPHSRANCAVNAKHAKRRSNLVADLVHHTRCQIVGLQRFSPHSFHWFSFAPRNVCLALTRLTNMTSQTYSASSKISGKMFPEFEFKCISNWFCSIYFTVMLVAKVNYTNKYTRHI